MFGRNEIVKIAVSSSAYTHCREVEVAYIQSLYLHVRYFVLSNAVVEVYECCEAFVLYSERRIFVLVKAIIHDILETNLNGLLPPCLCVCVWI